MTTRHNTVGWLVDYLQSSRDVQATVDKVVNEVLKGKIVPLASGTNSGPLLLGMAQAARVLGLSRTTLWRVIQAGRLRKVEVLPGSYRVRRADIEALAAGKEGVA